MEFYVIINDEQQGPYSMAQLATLDITPDTEVWAQGMADWQAAGDVPALTALLQQLEYKRLAAVQARPAPGTPPVHTPSQERPAPYVPEQRTFNTPSGPQQPQRRNHGCLLWSTLVIIAILAVLVLTVPSRDDHLGAIKDTTRQWMGATIEQTGMGGSILGEVAKWAGGTGADMVIDQIFTYDNYIVYSVGSFNYGTHSKTVSLGLLGHVFTFSKDDINQAIKNAMGIDETATPPAEVTPPAREEEPEPEPTPQQEQQPQLDENDPGSDNQPGNAAQELLDSITARAKREAVKAAKEWAKKKIDEM